MTMRTYMSLTMLAAGAMLAGAVDGQAAEAWYFQAQAPAVAEAPAMVDSRIAADRVTPAPLIAGDSGFRPWYRAPAEPSMAKVKRDC